MNDIHTLTRCEADANAARLQLERDLDVLRSPATVENFKQTIANEAVRVKDSVIESLTDSAKLHRCRSV